ncbi:MAG: beta-N-acetylhexosaminidase [Anaerolineales bacterium]|jgi:hexosaminidase|nr:beta-N-acetylhexosaminidase [Anaerolineales bacterium]
MSAHPSGPAALDLIIPIPASCVPQQGSFPLHPGTQLFFEPEVPGAKKMAEYLAEQLNRRMGFKLPVQANTGTTGIGSICLTTPKGEANLGTEGYHLHIQPEGVSLIATHPAGWFYAVQTLCQLLPPANDPPQAQPGIWMLPAADIQDAPRFAWRGCMLDVTRHFFDVNTVQRLIDQMAAYKLNRLHLHLSDDQGWRIEIKRWPQLAAIGGSTQVGGGRGGYYSQAEYAEIVEYAQARFITLVPEVEFPGHTQAALASYPELNVDEKAPELYTGTAVGFSSLSIHKPITYQFITDVIQELACLTPGEYVHIGGDEAFSTPLEDYRLFIERVQEIVHAQGKRAVGWGEIALAPLHPSTLAQIWHAGIDPALAVNQGAQVILSPANRIYLDMKYDEATELGLNWAGTVNTRSAYEWDPSSEYPTLPEEAILGIEAPLWTETILTPRDIDFMLFPRLVGVAEIAWSPKDLRSWEAYRLRLAEQAPHFRAQGIHYYPDPAIPWK